MAPIAADPQSLAVWCPTCGRPPLERCRSGHGQPTPTHKSRIAAGIAAAKEPAR